MAHVEIVAALTAFFGLFGAWFVVPSSAPAVRELSAATEATREAVPTAA